MAVHQADLPFPSMGRLETKFWEFHQENPTVYAQICAQARRELRKGRPRIGVSYFFESIRWDTTTETTDPDFKLCNSHRAFYSRMWLHEHPAHPEFFSLRAQFVPMVGMRGRSRKCANDG